VNKLNDSIYRLKIKIVIVSPKWRNTKSPF